MEIFLISSFLAFDGWAISPALFLETLKQKAAGQHAENETAA